jgi:hypothetical protein
MRLIQQCSNASCGLPMLSRFGPCIGDVLRNVKMGNTQLRTALLFSNDMQGGKRMVQCPNNEYSADEHKPFFEERELSICCLLKSPVLRLVCWNGADLKGMDPTFKKQEEKKKFLYKVNSIPEKTIQWLRRDEGCFQSRFDLDFLSCSI